MATLRRATVADAPDLTRLRALMHLSMGDEPTDAWQQQCLEAFTRRLQTATFVAYVVADAGVVLSGGCGWLEEHLPSPYALDGRRGHIASMSTDPSARRRGYGRMVFAALMDWFGERDIQRVDLRATSDGQPLYASFGFRVLGGAKMAWNAPGSRPGQLAEHS